MDENELAKLWAKGDRIAAETLVHRHYRSIFRFLWHATGSWHDAEDLAAQAILQASKDIRGFRGDGSVRGWLFRVAYRELLKYRRRLGVRRHFEPNRSASVESPNEDLVVLTAALRRLTAPQREAFLLVEVEGFTTDEAALLLRTSPGTIKSRCHYARLKLRELLAPAYPEVSNYVAPIPD